MIEQAFEVATEFKFDVGQAIIGTRGLQSAVDDLSQSAGQAQTALNYLASGLVAHLGFGSGGLLTVLTQAVKLSEEFDMASLGYANNIMSNFSVLSGTIDTFNDRLGTSKMIMSNISDAASKVGLPSGELAALSMKLATPLAQRGKLGTNYSGAINMGQNLMLASQNAQIPVQMASESLIRALTEGGGLHGKLFERLVNTQQFKSAHITTQPQLQHLQQDKKIDLIASALQSLAGDADALNYRLNMLHTQFDILKNQVMVVLLPIGQAIRGVLVNILKGINGYLTQNGKALGESIGKLIGNVFGDPKGLLVNIMQLKELGHDFKKSLHLLELVQTFVLIRWALAKIGVEFGGGLLLAGLRQLGAGLMWLWEIIPVGAILAGTFRLIRAAMNDVMPKLGAFMFLFQIFSRARAVAKINDAETMLTLTPKFLEVFGKMKVAMENIMMPITMAIGFWGDLLAPLFQWTFWAEIALPIFGFIADQMKLLGTAMIYGLAVISGVVMAIIGVFDDLRHLKNPMSHLGENWNDGIDSFLEKNKARLGQDGMAANYNVQNNNHIEARFDMREQLEPDRIAFAVTDKLMKLASNPRQSRGSSTKAVFGGATAFAANGG